MTRTASIFSQILDIINPREFKSVVRKYNGDKHSKGFTCWDQFVAMMFCQIGQAHSIREICKGLACCLGKLNHLGLAKAPKKSTLSYANAHRPWQIYQEMFYRVHERCQGIASRRKRKFRFKNKLLSLDASVIDLCLKMFPWAKFRTTKGAVKLHLLLDHDGYFPAYAVITEGKIHEVNIARQLTLPAKSIVAIDRGYYDFSLFGSWTANEIYFVTRMKSNTQYEVIRSKRIPYKHPSVLSDEIIRLTGQNACERCPHELRRVVVWDAEKERLFVFLTNIKNLGSCTISQIYKERWQIEIFFKALKQNLRVKTFVGTSRNALLIQIWTALIAMLVLKYLQLKSNISWSLSNLIALLHWNLFTYRDLWLWIDKPFEVPPSEPEFEQLSFLGQQI